MIFIHVMDHSGLLPGGPSRSEGPTVATRVLSFLHYCPIPNLPVNPCQ